MVDRNTQGSARNRFDLLRGEAENLDIQTRQLTDALETLVRIQARYIYNCIFMTKSNHNSSHICNRIVFDYTTEFLYKNQLE